MSNRCPLCNGYKSESTTTFTVDLKFGVLVVRHVPAVVCEQCGAEWIADAQAQKLENLVKETRKKQTMIEVAEFSALEKLAS